jgi:hypothetical protein
VAAYVRTVKTASGATAVQIVHSSRRGARDIEHLGSAHDDAELEVLKAAARYRLTAGQAELDLGLDFRGRHACWRPGWSAADHASRMGYLVDVLIHAYRVLGFEQCPCRKPYPHRSGGVLALVEDAAEPITSAYVETADLAWVRRRLMAKGPAATVTPDRRSARVATGGDERSRCPGEGRCSLKNCSNSRRACSKWCWFQINVRNYEGTACCQESCKSMHEVRRVAPLRCGIDGRVEPCRSRGQIVWARAASAADTRVAGGASTASS